MYEVERGETMDQIIITFVTLGIGFILAIATYIVESRKEYVD